jgi:hypothetical protein
MSCLLQADPVSRAPALHAGRRVTVHIAPGCVWDGQLDEPSPAQDGWTITAHGAGTFGAQFDASYSGAWGSASPDDVVNSAIGRGLRWVNPGIGTPSGIWLGSAPDPGSTKIDALMNLLCSRGALVWDVASAPGANTVTVRPLPTAVTRLLVAVAPAPVTAAELVNAIEIRYCTKADDNATGGTPATFTTTWVTSDGLIDAYGRNEEYLDLSNAGVLSLSSAQARGGYILRRYYQAAYAGPLAVMPGQYLTVDGTPVALACEHAGEVVQLVLADGGQVDLGVPTTFVVGGYAYDDDTGAAAVTPLGTGRFDFAGLAARGSTYHTGSKDPFGIKTGGL